MMMKNISQKIWTDSLSARIKSANFIMLLIILCMAFPHTSFAKNNAGGNSDLKQVSCMDIMKLDAKDRGKATILLHGYMFGKKGVTTFNPAGLEKASDAFIKYCRGHLKESALLAMEKIHNGAASKKAKQSKQSIPAIAPSGSLQKAPSAKSIPTIAPSGSLQKAPTTQGTPGFVQAFPTAVGYGAKSVGGRGGKIIYVTTLEDNWSPGSLRYALYKASGPRIIVFRVGGVIELKEPRGAISKDIGIINPYVTIAGQTAPGDGICIKNGGIAIYTHDVIIRHLCVRPGDKKAGTDPEDRDAIKIVGGYNVILDHISASWSIDETISTWFKDEQLPPRDITIQNSIISEGLYKSLHPKVYHSRGLLVGDHSSNVTIFQNIFAHNNRRNPLVKGNTKNIDIINNVIYNWGNNKGFGTNFSDIEHRGPTFTSIINNYYIKGPNSGDNYFYFDNLNKNSKILVNGNSGDISEKGYRNKSKYPFVFVVKGPFNNNNIPMNKINTPLSSILQNAGAFVPVRDKVDQRIILDVKNKTGKIINTVAEVGGYPKLRGGTPFQDSDRDGISDKWETSRNLNPNDSSDANNVSANGYTNIEVFLNELAGD